MRKYNKFLKVIMVLVLCIGIFPLHIQDTYGYEIDSQWNDDETLKVLSIGNSFSVDSQQYLYQIAQDLGVKNIKLGNLYIGGCTLATHLENAKNESNAYTYYTNDSGSWGTTKNISIKAAVLNEDWDYITFQQASGSSGLADTYDDLQELMDIVRELQPDAKFGWNMTWAYQGNSNHADFKNYNKNQKTMYNSIVSAVQNKVDTNKDIDFVIPTGTSVQNARTSFLGDTLTRDGYHLSYDVGRYIAGITFAHAFTGLDIDKLSYKPSGVSDKEKAMAIESVKNAFSKPYEVTKSQYQIDFSELEKASLTLTNGGFYNSSAKNGKHYTLDTTSAISPNFVVTQKFTKATLPVGSVIVIADGWQYRPEGWINGAVNTAAVRPGNVSSNQVVVDATWWGNFTERAFNISKNPTSSLANVSDDEINEIFQIYIPKNLEYNTSNLAYMKNVYASSTYAKSSFAAAHAVDGDMGTRWGNAYNVPPFDRGQGDTEETITVDLGDTYNIGTVSISWEAAHATNYTIQGSLDGETFFDIKDITKGNGETEVHELDAVETRYVRLAMHTPANQYGYSIYELEVYEAKDTVALDEIYKKIDEINEEKYSDATLNIVKEKVEKAKSLAPTATQDDINQAVTDIQKAIDGLEARYPNLALDKETSASSTYAKTGYGTSYAVDGKVDANKWQVKYNDINGYNNGNGNLEENLTVNLGAVYPIDMIAISWEKSYAKNFTIQGSLDGKKFFDIKDIKDNTPYEDKQRIEYDGLGNIKTQYVRLAFHAPKSEKYKYGYALYELEVYEKNPDSRVYTNLAFGKKVTTTSTYKNANNKFDHSHITDGDLDSRWGNAYNGDAYKENPFESVVVDLEKEYPIDRIIVTFESSHAKKYNVLGSKDGQNYSLIQEVTDGTKDERIFTNVNTSVRYIKLELLEPSGNYGYSIYEIEAYEKRSSELDNILNQVKDKLSKIEIGTVEGTMLKQVYQKYVKMISNAEKLIANKESFNNDIRLSIIELRNALLTIDNDIITAKTTVSIYPTAQDITYDSDNGMVLNGSTVDILVHGKQDQATLPKVQQLLKKNGYTYQFVEKIGTNPVVVLANDCDNECVICDSVKDNQKALEKKQGYVMNISNDEHKSGQITIIGSDEDGVYYGVMSLLQVFEQKTEDNHLAEITVSDYPDVEFRGYVEGFYGFPWTFEERASLFEDTSKYKMTTYIYAPKDDIYHRDEWRKLYPAEKAKHISDLVNVAKENNMDFCWTIHPAADYNFNADSGDYETLIKKFEQVYDLGVRQFGIFYDDLDLSIADGKKHAKLINDVYQYLDEKYGDVKPFITVTSRYNNSWGGDWVKYFTPFMKTVHPDTIVLWTGQHTMSAITKDYFETPKKKTGVDRDLGVWWNYPVTDYCYGKLLMGSLDILDTDVDNINSFFLNPMSEADASKVTIFSGADYAWNTGTFDSISSWKRSIKELVPEAHEEFERFADNISYIDLPERKSGFKFEESQYLKEDLDKFENALKYGDNFKTEIANMKAKFKQMLDDVQALRKIKNKNLLSEVEKHIDAYEDMAKAGIAAMEGYEYALQGDIGKTIDKISELENALSKSGSHIIDTIKGQSYVVVGSYRITPLLEKSINNIREILNLNIDYPIVKERMITSIDNLDIQNVKKDGSTYSISNIKTTMNKDDYITITLPKAMNFYKIDANISQNDAFKLQYSLDGLSWNDVGSVVDNHITSQEVVTGAYVRIVSTKDNAQLDMKQLSVTEGYQPLFVNVVSDLSTYKTNVLNNAVDGDLTTCFWSNSYAKDNNYISVDLGNLATLNKVELYNGISKGKVDGFVSTELEISKDGVIWTKVGKAQSINDYIDVDDTMKKIVFDAKGATARYFRFVASGTTDTWTKIYEIVYDATYLDYDNHLKVDTNIPVDTETDKIMDNDMNTSLTTNRVSQNGDYISVDFGTLVPLYDASIYLDKNETFKNLKLQTSLDGKTWIDAGDYLSNDKYTISGNHSIATFGTDGSLVRYIRFVTNESSESSVRIYEIKYNQTLDAAANTSLNTDMKEYKSEFTLDKAMDGNVNTKFYSGSGTKVGNYIQVDLGSSISIHDYSIWFAVNPKKVGEVDGFKEMKVQISQDGKTWSDVGEKMAVSDYIVKGDKYLATSNLNGVVARYVRFVATERNSNWLQVYEIEFNKTVDASDLKYIDNNSTININNSHYIDDQDITTHSNILQVKNGQELIYPMTTCKDVLKIGILQDHKVLSNAKVSVQDLNGKWKEIGSLDKAWKLFDIHSSILAVKVTFNDSVDPVIYEIIVYGGADYTKVREVLERVPNDLSIYDKKTVQALNNAIKAVVYNKEASEQEIVDKYVKDISNAIKNLKYKLADYTKVNELLKKIPSDLSIYDANKVKNLKDVINSIDFNKDFTKQSEVDQYAKDLQKAIDELLKSAVKVPTKPNDTDDSNAPESGDHTNTTLWISLLLASGIGVLAAIVYSKNRNNNK